VERATPWVCGRGLRCGLWESSLEGLTHCVPPAWHQRVCVSLGAGGLEEDAGRMSTYMPSFWTCFHFGNRWKWLHYSWFSENINTCKKNWDQQNETYLLKFLLYNILLLLNVCDYLVDGRTDASRQKYCSFKLALNQGLYIYFQELGLARAYMTDRGTNSFIRKLLCLPFLPAEHIEPMFEAMRENNGTDQLTPLLEYVGRTWVTSQFWPVSCWSVYGQPVRTNNDCEGK